MIQLTQPDICICVRRKLKWDFPTWLPIMFGQDISSFLRPSQGCTSYPALSPGSDNSLSHSCSSLTPSPSPLPVHLAVAELPCLWRHWPVFSRAEEVGPRQIHGACRAHSQQRVSTEKAPNAWAHTSLFWPCLIQQPRRPAASSLEMLFSHEYLWISYEFIPLKHFPKFPLTLVVHRHVSPAVEAQAESELYSPVWLLLSNTHCEQCKWERQCSALPAASHSLFWKAKYQSMVLG